ncbi:MAG: right-handed parallel beta-helix repeat-containing protein [Firmicutes bacterium]|nr:right-handed parallel beta-helix repeat-containing protein [Bacillota bacterium]
MKILAVQEPQPQSPRTFALTAILGAVAMIGISAYFILSPQASFVPGSPRQGLYWRGAEWSGEVELRGPVIIPRGQTLRLQPGTNVLVKSSQVTIKGRVVAPGTTREPIVFSRIPDQTGEKGWEGLELLKGSLLEYVTVEHATVRLTGEGKEESRGGKSPAGVADPTPDLEQPTIVAFSTFRNESGSCLELESGTAYLLHNQFSGCGRSGIRVASGDLFTVLGNQVEGSPTGISLTEAAVRGTIRENIITGVRLGVETVKGGLVIGNLIIGPGLENPSEKIELPGGQEQLPPPPAGKSGTAKSPRNDPRNNPMSSPAGGTAAGEAGVNTTGAAGAVIQRAGVVIAPGSTATVEGNTLSGLEGAGIVVIGRTSARVSHNVIRENRGTGILCLPPAWVELAGNEIGGNDGGAMAGCPSPVE